MKWFREGLVFEARSFVYHSAVGSRTIKKKKTFEAYAMLMTLSPNLTQGGVSEDVLPVDSQLSQGRGSEDVRGFGPVGCQ